MMKVTDLPNDLCFSALSETQMDSNGIKHSYGIKIKSKNYHQNTISRITKEARWEEKVRKCGNVRQQLSNQQSSTTIDKWCLRPRKKANVSKKIQVIFLTVKEWDFRICGRSNFSASLRQNHAHFGEDKEHSPLAIITLEDVMAGHWNINNFIQDINSFIQDRLSTASFQAKWLIHRGFIHYSYQSISIEIKILRKVSHE